MMSTTQRTSQVMTLLVTCFGLFMVLLDASIVNVALPTIQADLHANLSDLQWVIDAYTLPLAALMLTAGTLGDRFGRKRLFLAGLVLFVLGSLLCGFAPTLGWLLFGRAVQGVGAAALLPGSLSVLVAAYPEPRARAQAIGIWAGVSGVALAAGPLVGGVLIQISSWPAIFFVNLPVGVLALALGWPLLAESRNPKAQGIDLPGQVLVTGFLVCLIMALIEGPSQGWTSPLILGLFSGAAVLLAAFLIVEARVREPMLPLGLFANRVFSVGNVAGLLLFFTMFGTFFFVTQFFQAVQGYTALEAGLRTLPTTMGIFLIAPFAGLLTARLGPRLPTVLGALLAASALLLVTRLEPDSSYGTLWWNFGILGIGFGLMISPLAAAVLSATPPTRAGLGSSVNNTSRQIGGALGVAVLGTVVLQQFTSNITSQLAQVGVPEPLGATIASRIAAAGAQASQVRLSGRLPLPPAALHQAINQAFVDALHVPFLITGIIMLVTAVLVAGLLWQKQPATVISVATAQARVLTGASAQSQVLLQARETNRSRALLGVMLALVARRAQQPEADPAVLAALSSTVNGRYPADWSEEERGRAVAREILEPLSILLLASAGSLEAGNAPGGAAVASGETIPAAGETPSNGL
jgi:DHA2 family methylenomycin A resistance protein-like MFS transporter